MNTPMLRVIPASPNEPKDQGQNDMTNMGKPRRWRGTHPSMNDKRNAAGNRLNHPKQKAQMLPDSNSNRPVKKESIEAHEDLSPFLQRYYLRNESRDWSGLHLFKSIWIEAREDLSAFLRRTNLLGQMRNSIYFHKVRLYGKQCVSYSFDNDRYYLRNESRDWSGLDPYKSIWIEALEDLSAFLQRTDLLGQMRNSIYLPKVISRNESRDWSGLDPFKSIWVEAPEDLTDFLQRKTKKLAISAFRFFFQP
ncbi:hypothetical protein BUALT_Bualt11G0097100 [Buddleja alternifolia]|uniref:Uncharacterized protein n=1 Tax=Buddleja alternifolia TaxID=168488 RepID=A0AAV6WUR1_9LAMI|nr:hypothetical protein BUALT_Bualt11G0097100 [Buddleja alternifolia]